MVRSTDFGDRPSLNPEFTAVESDKDPTSVGSSNKGLYWFTAAGVGHRID